MPEATKTRLIYLHGFASSPQSTKARYFGEKFAAIGRPLETPDLSEGDFEHTTLTRQLKFLESFVGNQPAILMGSSMGGYLAALFAARHTRLVRGVVLMAPAFGMAVRWTRLLGQEVMVQWQTQGWRPIYHYGDKSEARISFDLVSDGLQYEEYPDVRCPALLLHGRRDESVDYRLSERFIEGKENAELVLYDSDHQLLGVVDAMWDRVRNFVEKVARASGPRAFLV